MYSLSVNVMTAKQIFFYMELLEIMVRGNYARK